MNNPELVSDEELNDPLAFEALVRGAIGDIAYGATVSSYGGLFTIGSLLTDELVASENRQGPRVMSDGEVPNDIGEAENWWEDMASGRWEAEDAIRRIGGLVEDSASNPLIAEATIWAAFANRISGDSYCDAVINGGPLQPHTAFYERAEMFFTSAIEIAGNAGIDSMVVAAYAGRAQTRMMLGDWDGALADVAMVVDDDGEPINGDIFVINNTGRNDNEYWTYSRGAERYLVWGTPFQDWGVSWTGDRTVGDPRVVYEIKLEDDGSIAIGPDLRRWKVTPGADRVPFTVVRKEAPSPDYDDDQRVSVYDVSNELCFEVSLEEILSNPNIEG